MSDVAIRVDKLGKQYRIGAVQHNGSRYRYRSLRDTLADFAFAPLRPIGRIKGRDGTAKTHEENTFWALKDISFEVKQGEVVGIIGRNGAGKSTLLKILSRITEPTSGRIEVRGRVASLLEVGTGFHPELTGRENVYMNGAIMGMKRAEIGRKFDEIVAFAEVEKFLDTPVKHYSSGMYMRLAFAVAAHLEQEILVIDEVLAVGDAEFQKKCLGKMRDVSKRGRTVLFVSHNMSAIQTLCSRGIWFLDGKVMGAGPAGKVVSEYLQSNTAACMDRAWKDSSAAPGNEFIRLHHVRVTAKHPEQITVSDAIMVEFCYWNAADTAELNLSLHLYNLEDTCIFSSISNPSRRAAGLIRDVCEIPGHLLNDGTYRVRIMFVQAASRVLFDCYDAAVFTVNDVPRDVKWYGKMPGVVRPRLVWRPTELAEAGQ